MRIRDDDELCKFFRRSMAAPRRQAWCLAPFAILAVVLTTVAAKPASAEVIRVTVENLGVDGGTYVTPVFVGFHDGTFDLFDPGSAASVELERSAEDGNAGPLGAAFNTAGRVGDTVGTGPIAPGTSATSDFVIDLNGPASRLLVATMVLPTNDWFLSSGDPDAFDVSDLLNGPISFDLNRLYDAGTEIDDFSTSAGNPLLSVPGGQSGPNQGADENENISFLGTIQPDGSLLDAENNLVADPFGGFANAPADFNPPLSAIRVTVSAVPEPGTMLASGLIAIGAIATRRQRKRKVS